LEKEAGDFPNVGKFREILSEPWKISVDFFKAWKAADPLLIP
jgi:hypothetical protein